MWVREVEPRLLHPPRSDRAESRERAKVAIIQRAVAYQEAEHTAAFRDWVAHLDRWQTQLIDDLKWGHLRRGRVFGTTDDEIRAMLYMLHLVLDVPAQAKAAYERLRAMEEQAAAALVRAEERFGASYEAD